MRKLLSTLKALIVEVIGLFGGLFWGKSTNWDYEPLILFITSLACILITLALIFSKKSSEQVNKSVDAKKILADIEKTTPYLRNQAKASYVGLKIQWKVSFESISNINTNTYHVTTRYKGGYPWIYFNIDIEHYPILKVATKRQNFLIAGKIKNLGGNTVTIDVEEINEAA